MYLEKELSIVALFVSLILAFHLIFQIFTLRKQKKLFNLLNGLLFFNTFFHAFFIFIFYSGILYSYRWFSPVKFLNMYFGGILYIMYVRRSVIDRYRFEPRDFLSLSILIFSQIAWIFIKIIQSGQTYTQITDTFIAKSIPEAFPSLNYIPFLFVSYLWFLIMNLYWLHKTYRSEQFPTLTNGGENMKGKSLVKYFALLAIFTMGTRILYFAAAWIGGRQWAIYYNFVDFMLIIIIFAYHEIHPLLVRAKILKPLSTNFSSADNQFDDLILRKNIIYLNGKRQTLVG